MDLLKICKNRKSIIGYIYRQENSSFFKDIHICGTNIKDATSLTAKVVNECKLFYCFVENKKIVAFFAKDTEEEINVLTSFHVVPKYRNMEFLNYFWNTIKKLFNSSIFVGIYDKNIIAFNHLLKQGFMQINKVDNILILKLCQ